MSLSHTSILQRLRLVTIVFGVLLFALMLASSVRQAHAATTYVQSGTITLCHAGSGASNTWNTLIVNATIPATTGVTFQTQSAQSCSATPGAFTGKVFTVANNSNAAQDISTTTASQAIFIQITLTGNGTATPVLNSATLADTPGSTSDTTAPTSTLAAISGNSGTLTLSATASDNTGGSGVANVSFYESTGTCNANATLIGTDTTGSSGTYTTSLDTTGLTNGTVYHICSIATDVAGNVQTTPSVQNLTPNNSTSDTTPPTSTLSSPGTGSLSGSVTLSATATDNSGGSGVANVKFYDVAGTGTCNSGSTLIGTDTSATGTTYSTSWDTTTVANGTYKVCSVATDNAGNAQGTPSSQSVTISNTVSTSGATSFLSPTNGATVTPSASTTVKVNTNGYNPGVKSVAFKDGSSTIGSDTSGTSDSGGGNDWSVTWNTSALSGSHTLTATVTDTSGATQTPASITVNVGSGSDTQPPSAPGSLSASATSATSAHLSWTASTDNVGVTGYRVFRGATQVGTTTGSTTFDDTGLSGSTSYAYTVKAVDAAGNLSAASNTANVTTPAPPDTQAPTAPGSLSASATASTNVHLTWNASTDNVGVTGYNIYRNGGTTPSFSTTATSFDDSTVSPTTTYSYVVKAFDAAGNLSPASNSSSATTPCTGDCTAPSTPTGLTGSASTVGTTAVKVSLSWNASTDNVGVTSYVVLRGGTVIATGVGTNSYSDTTVQPNTNYSYTVEAKDAAGNVSGQSNTFSVKTPSISDTQAPTVPTNVSATAISSTQVNVSWSASTDNVGVDHYLVLRNGVLVGTVSTTTFGDGSVSGGTTYNYTVEAVDSSGNTSASSTAATVTTPQTTQAGTTPVYRLYQSPTSDHLYTTSQSDVALAESVGYVFEGVAFNAYASSANGVGVTRLYSPASGHHFLTISQSDITFAENAGFRNEGVVFNEDAASSSNNNATFRLYQPQTGDHFYTISQSDVTAAENGAGYKFEGTVWYSPK
jgi:chitodextrinase